MGNCVSADTSTPSQGSRSEKRSGDDAVLCVATLAMPTTAPEGLAFTTESSATTVPNPFDSRALRPLPSDKTEDDYLRLSTVSSVEASAAMSTSDEPPRSLRRSSASASATISTTSTLSHLATSDPHLCDSMPSWSSSTCSQQGANILSAQVLLLEADRAVTVASAELVEF